MIKDNTKHKNPTLSESTTNLKTNTLYSNYKLGSRDITMNKRDIYRKQSLVFYHCMVVSVPTLVSDTSKSHTRDP